MDYQHFMSTALDQADEALQAGEFPVGCVLVHQYKVVAAGMRRGTSTGVRNETDHAEIVALQEFYKLENMPDPREITAFCTMEPCLMCFGALLIAGIGEIVYAYEDVMGGGTHCDLSRLPALYSDNPVSIVPGIMRAESLALFKTFFSATDNDYWKNSQLEAYTLAQLPGKHHI
ncbi:MAG: nucleoside deaminase [Desulfobacterales bacterium]|nr:nucleoside deaminase [Desulfobacterales bacterium]